MSSKRVDLFPVLDGLSAAIDDGALHFVEARDGKALARLRVPSPRTSLDSSVAAIIVGKAAAVAAAGTAFGNHSPLGSGDAPRAVELSVNLFRDANAGVLSAEAETLFRGRSTAVVHVKVRDETPGLVAALVVTQLAARSEDATAEPARRAS
jgi:acyl-coenzyme A thioesterase PaaI-like protein